MARALVAVSGTLGYSYAGLDLLEGGHVDPSARGDEQLGDLAPFVDTYRAPRPPLGSGVAAAAAGARAMMDLSDGPATDAARIAKASGVVIEFDREAIEAEASHLAPAARVCAVDPVRWVLQGGEEHGAARRIPRRRCGARVPGRGGSAGDDGWCGPARGVGSFLG